MFSPEIARQLRERFDIDAVSVLDEPTLRGLEDSKIFAAAQQAHRIVVTEDVGDFRIVAIDWQAAGKDHYGLIFTTNRRFPRARDETTGALIRALREVSERPHGADPTNREIWL